MREKHLCLLESSDRCCNQYLKQFVSDKSFSGKSVCICTSQNMEKDMNKFEFIDKGSYVNVDRVALLISKQIQLLKS